MYDITEFPYVIMKVKLTYFKSCMNHSYPVYENTNLTIV